MENNKPYDFDVTIDDFSSICRLCLKRDKLKLIFKNNDDQCAADENVLSISTNRMITECCGLEVWLMHTCNIRNIFIFKFYFHLDKSR